MQPHNEDTDCGMQEIDELVDEWNPQPLVEQPSELDLVTLPTIPMIHGPNGARVKLSPNGKTVSPDLACPELC